MNVVDGIGDDQNNQRRLRPRDRPNSIGLEHPRR
jgi:hypothetical protein